jgi:NhaA family Na+:H+ antiporter
LKLTEQPSRRGRISPLRAFLRSESSGGVILIGAAVLALVAANSVFAATYFYCLERPIGPLSVQHWINDALMAVFFLLVGLEIKREFADGHLASWADRRLPVIAAIAGMVLPALIYLLIAGRQPGLARGWAIPAATDIAFAIGVLALLGRRAPATLNLFLTTVAIIDDLGAIIIIAIDYTARLHGWPLGIAAMILLTMIALNRRGEMRLWPYLMLGAGLWLAVLLSGVHATVAGVLTAFVIPVRRNPGTPDAADAPLHRLEHALEPVVAYGIVPLFGFANAGVALGKITWPDLIAPLPLAVGAGLFIGKQIGIFTSVWLAVALGVGTRPRDTTWLQVYGVALLCGIGFTMSLFIGGLAFSDPTLVTQVKIGVIEGSLAAAVLGFIVLRFAPTARRSARLSR